MRLMRGEGSAADFSLPFLVDEVRDIAHADYEHHKVRVINISPEEAVLSVRIALEPYADEEGIGIIDAKTDKATQPESPCELVCNPEAVGYYHELVGYLECHRDVNDGRYAAHQSSEAG